VTRRVVLTPGAESSATGVSLTALTERVHSDGAIPPGRKCFLLMIDIRMVYLEVQLLMPADDPGLQLLVSKHLQPSSTCHQILMAKDSM